MIICPWVSRMGFFGSHGWIRYPSFRTPRNHRTTNTHEGTSLHTCGCFLKWWVFSPQIIPCLIGVFHYVHHPFWGKIPLFLEISISRWWQLKHFFIFTPTLGFHDPIWLAHIFQMGWWKPTNYIYNYIYRYTGNAKDISWKTICFLIPQTCTIRI